MIFLFALLEGVLVGFFVWLGSSNLYFGVAAFSFTYSLLAQIQISR